MLYKEATEEWYALRDPDEVDHEDRNSLWKSTENDFSPMYYQSPIQSVAAHLESYLLHVYYISQLDNLYGDKEIGVGLDNIAKRLCTKQNVG